VFWLARGLASGEPLRLLWGAAFNSVYVSALAAVVAALAALPVAILAVRFPGWVAGFIERLSYLGYALPGIVLALSLVFFGANYAPGLYGTLALLVFAYAISWVFAWVGLLVPSPEVINNASFIVIFPLTFVANTFVPLDSLPGPLRVFAEWNPVSAVTQAARNLFGNADPNPLAPPPTAWPLQNPVLYTLIWAVVVLLVFVPLANRQYRRAASR